MFHRITLKYFYLLSTSQIILNISSFFEEKKNYKCEVKRVAGVLIFYTLIFNPILSNINQRKFCPLLGLNKKK